MFQKIAWLGAGSLLVLTALNGCVIDGSESGANASVEAQTDIATAYDTDSKREGALGLIFGMPPIDDRLDYAHNDKEDWRYIIVAEPGTMSITLTLDTPQDIEGGWNIYDSNERVLHRQSFSHSQVTYEFPSFPVKPGLYYFQTYASSGKSVYTLGTSLSAYQPAPAPEPEPRHVETTPTTQPTPKPAPKPSPKTPKTDSDSKPSKPSAPAESNSGQKVTGFISLITPQADGTAKVKISNCGKNKGIESGAIGKLEGLNIKIEMMQCLPTSCTAILPASVNVKSLKEGANVIFYVK